MKTIYDNVEIKQDLEDTDGNPYYTLNFDGVSISVPFEPTKEQLYCFKSAICGERERIWDECEDIGQDNRMKVLLKMDYMKRNFVKINETDYFMVSEPTEADKEMIDNGYEKVTDAQFDKAFNLYEKVQKKEITYKDVLRELISIGKLQIANELLKNTTNIYLKDLIEDCIANIKVEAHSSEGDYVIDCELIGLDLCIAYIEKEKFDISGWQLFEIPIEYAHVFYNPKKKKMFDIAVFEGGKVTPRYISKGNEKDATSILEAIEKYDTDINSNSTHTENAEILQTFIKEMISYSIGEKGDFSFELLRWSELQPYWCVFACKRDGGECLTGIKGVTGIGGHYCIGEEANLHSVLSELVNSGWPVVIQQCFYAEK